MGAAASLQTLEKSKAWRDLEPQLRTQIQSVIEKQQEHIQTVEDLLKGRIVDGVVKMRDQQLHDFAGPLQAQDKQIATLQKKLDAANRKLVAIEAALMITPANVAVASISKIFRDSKDTDSDGRCRSIRSSEDRKEMSETIQKRQASIFK